MTIGPGNDVGPLVTQAIAAGASRRALNTAAYVNFGFNVITRVADGIGVSLPEAADVNAAARLLLTVGYRPLTGRIFQRVRFDAARRDPFEPMVNDLRAAALRGRAALGEDVRQTIYRGAASGQLGAFAHAVAERAWTVVAQDVDALRTAGFSEDEVFEAVVCAALGAATRRLDPLLQALAAVPIR